MKEVRRMDVSSKRIEKALAAYLEYLEIGGRPPDTSHLSASEQEELRILIEAVDLTEGVAFGLGHRQEAGAVLEPPAANAPRGTAQAPRLAASEELVSELRRTLPFDARIEWDPEDCIPDVGGIAVLDRWIVRTFGGRVRLWLLASDVADEFERNTATLVDLGQAFRTFSETTAIALVARDLSCLLIEPQDSAPQIQVPGGLLVVHQYKRPILPVSDAIGGFLSELLPHWDPVPAVERRGMSRADLENLVGELVKKAIEGQRATGSRAHKANPRREALLALGEREIARLKRLAIGLFESSVKPGDVEGRLSKIVKDP
jgi:hypothetical protein